MHAHKVPSSQMLPTFQSSVQRQMLPVLFKVMPDLLVGRRHTCADDIDDCDEAFIVLLCKTEF